MKKIIVLSVLAASFGAGAWTLDQKTSIVIPEKRAKSAVWCALDESAGIFAGAVQERMGFRPQIVPSDARVPGKAIYLGARFARAAGFDTGAFKRWENEIAEKDGSIYLFGQEEHAGWLNDDRSIGWAHCVLPCVRALTRFMETYMDVRFVMPGVVGMEVRPGAVNAPDGLASRETPLLDYGAGHNRGILSSIANQCFGAGDYKTYGGHLYPVACPMEKYAKTHPEYFGIVKGKRYCEWPWARGGFAPLCFTNPEVEELIIAELLRNYDAGAHACQLAPGDSALYCECEKCQNYGGLKGNAGTHHCEQLWLFHRHIAERIEKLRPGKVVHILSYGPTHHPPRDFKTFPSNVMIEVCEATEETLKLWHDFGAPHGLTTYIYLWGNYKLVGYTPRHSVRELAETARMFIKYGVHGIYRCGYGELWGLEGPGYYVFNRMLRDPASDIEATYAEFCDAAFGPAAKTMRKFYDTYDVRLDRIRPVAEESIDVNGGAGFMATFAKDANLAMLMKMWPEDVLAEMGRLLGAAETTPGLTARQIQRLGQVRLEYDYLVRLMRVISRYAAFKERSAAATALPLLDAIDDRNAQIDRLINPKTGYTRISEKWPEMALFSYASRELLQHNGRSAGKIDEPLTLDTSLYRAAYDVARWKREYAANPKLVRLTAWQRSPGHERATVEIGPGGKTLHLVPGVSNHDVRVHCPFAAKPATRYRLSWFLKLKDAKTRDPRGVYPGFAMIRNGEKYDEYVKADIPPLKVATTDWMRQSVEFETLDRPKINGEISFRLYNATGEAWFEDVVLEDLSAPAPAAAPGAVNVDFARGKWNPDDWTVVKGPRWDYCHGFVQKDGWIENETPAGLSPEEIVKKRSADVYSGMVWKNKFPLGSRLSMTTGWDWQMAPLMVIAPELGTSKDGKHPEFRDHWEIVVYEDGLNVWHHYWTPEKGPHWIKAASLILPKDRKFKPNVKHTLEVRVFKNGKGRKEMVCLCNGYRLQYVDDTLPDSFYAGILGCEGRNFFWNFSAK